jgi:hypothetical protein
MLTFSNIVNYKSTKIVEGNLEHNPFGKEEKFIIQEKYDGSNFQIIFVKNEPTKFASRNQLILETDAKNKFNTYKKTETVCTICSKIETFLKDDAAITKIYLFGEIYGRGIQKRLDYGPNVEFRIFDLNIDDVWQSQKEMYSFCKRLDIDQFIVRDFGIHEFLECLKFDYESVENIEGIVIKPYEMVNHNLQFKRIKNDFDELNQQGVKREKEVKPKKVTFFELVLDKNRILSNYGKDEWESIGEFAKFVLDDCKKAAVDQNIEYQEQHYEKYLQIIEITAKRTCGLFL